MRKSNGRVCLELKKELGRSSSLVWVAALFLWLTLSAFKYSYWNSVSHHLLHNSWLSGRLSTVALRHPYLQTLSAPFSDGSTSLASLQQFNATATGVDRKRGDVDHGNDGAKNYLGPLAEKESTFASKFQSYLSLEDNFEGNTSTYNYTHGLDGEMKVMNVDIVEAGTKSNSSNYENVHEIQDEQKGRDPLKTCATVEEMGLLASNPLPDSSLRVRKMIKDFFSEHGASHVRELPAKEFCQRGFVFGRATEDGLGNDIYKILTAAGLSIMLNRSLIIAEHGSTNPAYIGLAGHARLPFGDYLRYSDQTFFLHEVKELWVKHDCVGTYKRPFTMIVDDFQRPTRTKVFCDNWADWRHPIIWFKGTTDSNALQFFLKNQHLNMRESAKRLFGDPSEPLSRPNVFGELFKAFISPMPVIEEAVNWVLQGQPDPDISVHMRMLNSKSFSAPHAAYNCIQKVIKNSPKSKSLARVVLVSDTPYTVALLKEQLEGVAQVIHFDYELFIRSQHNLSEVLSKNYFKPPEKRVRDWGSMPRWVAIVDMFLAARAKTAVISGANRRVGTTYVQLLAALAAARRLAVFKLHS
ncbi:hypothetical protein KP509_15G042000 [Ceratopteris richardii]|uniref:Uncharacterized protein n=1 Tax=Ceratopteris richardii TaxID=49495 RepID=A0A8T2T8W0_CERRI|nr:hypothetical protein KP509_15G042000 [Ceratopteris richardii]